MHKGFSTVFSRRRRRVILITQQTFQKREIYSSPSAMNENSALNQVVLCMPPWRQQLTSYSCSPASRCCWCRWLASPAWRSSRWKTSGSVVASWLSCCWLLSAFHLFDYLAACLWLSISIWMLWLVVRWRWWMLMSFDRRSACQTIQSCRIPANIESDRCRVRLSKFLAIMVSASI